MKMMAVVSIAAVLVLVGCASANANNQCSLAAIEQIYATPEEYDGKFICSKAVLVFLGISSVALVPQDAPLNGPWSTLLYVTERSGDIDPMLEIRTKALQHGMFVNFTGYFSFDKECWHPSPDGEQIVCAPVEKPMFLRLINIDAAQ